MLKKISYLGLAFILVFIAAGCGQSGKSQEVVELKIGTLPIVETFPLVVAQNNGYYTEQNLKVELVPFQSAVERDNALQSGQLDGVISDLISTTLVKDAGVDVKIASLSLGATPQEGRFAILVPPGSNVSSIEDLKGKSIGIANNTIIEYVTDGLLKEAGLNPSDIEKVNVPKIPTRLEMLLSGQVDAVNLPDPLAAFAEFKGAKTIVEDTTTNLSQSVLIMTGKALKDKEEGVKRFFQAYTKAIEEITSSPDNYRELFVKEARVPEEIQDKYNIPPFSKPQLPNETEVMNVVNWLTEKGLLKTEIKYEDLIQKDLY